MLAVYFRRLNPGSYRVSIDFDKYHSCTYYRNFWGYSKRECLKMIREEIYKKLHVKRVKLTELGERKC